MVYKVRDERNTRRGSLRSDWRQPGFIYGKGFPIAQNHGTLDYILQFANVARPVVSLKQVQGSLIDISNLFTSSLRVTIDQVFDQQRNVVNALAQCRYSNRENTEAVEQILSEGAFSHGCTQVHICSREDSYIHRNCLTSTDSFEFPFLQNS